MGFGRACMSFFLPRHFSFKDCPLRIVVDGVFEVHEIATRVHVFQLRISSLDPGFSDAVLLVQRSGCEQIQNWE